MMKIEKQINKFIAQMMEAGLEIKKERLSKEFREAAQDQERNSEIELWDMLSQEFYEKLNRMK